MYLGSALFEPYNSLEKNFVKKKTKNNQTKQKNSGTRWIDLVLLNSVQSRFEDLVQSVLKVGEGCPLISPGFLADFHAFAWPLAGIDARWRFGCLAYCSFRRLKDFKKTVDFARAAMEICWHFATFTQSNESVPSEGSRGVLMWSSCQGTRWRTEALTFPFRQPWSKRQEAVDGEQQTVGV